MELAILYTKVPASVKKKLIDPYVSIADNEVRLLARVLDSKPDLRRNELLEKVHRDLGKEFRIKELATYKTMIKDVKVSGLLVLYNNMLQSLFASQIKTIGVVMLGIAITFLVLWSIFLLLYTFIGLPLGIGSSYTYP